MTSSTRNLQSPFQPSSLSSQLVLVDSEATAISTIEFLSYGVPFILLGYHTLRLGVNIWPSLRVCTSPGRIVPHLYSMIKQKCLPWGTSLRGAGSPVTDMLDNKKLPSNKFKISGFLLAVSLTILSNS